MGNPLITSNLLEDDREQLVESVRRFIERDYGFDARQRALAMAGGSSPETWRQFAELGWLGIGLPEDGGGLGGPMDQCALAEVLGSAGVVEPWLSSCVLAGSLLTKLGGPQALALLGRLSAGEQRLALAAWERQGRYDAFDVITTARADGDGWILDGRKTLVLGGAQADGLLVLARSSGAARDTAGLSLLLVPVDAPGLSRHGLPTYDGRQTAEILLTSVRVGADALLGEVGQAWPAVQAAIDQASVMLCAESVGAMSRCLTLTREYLQTRKQFGKAITDNQVIRHRLVDLLVATEQSRAITEAAAIALDGHDAARRQRAVSLAKAFVSSAGRRVGEDAVQLHGAIGMTDDYEVGQCYKRLAAAANLFGDAEWHLSRLG